MLTAEIVPSGNDDNEGDKILVSVDGKLQIEAVWTVENIGVGWTIITNDSRISDEEAIDLLERLLDVLSQD